MNDVENTIIWRMCSFTTFGYNQEMKLYLAIFFTGVAQRTLYLLAVWHGLHKEYLDCAITLGTGWGMKRSMSIPRFHFLATLATTLSVFSPAPCFTAETCLHHCICPSHTTGLSLHTRKLCEWANSFHACAAEHFNKRSFVQSSSWLHSQTNSLPQIPDSRPHLFLPCIHNWEFDQSNSCLRFQD